ncbi:MAG: SDR family oxidoreductase [Desulfobacterales bacterium]|nr:SDR family oxidoreductase [Desulfobacterales bacterium]
MNFTGKKILITGSSRGIGYATAKLFLEAGAHVAVNGRTQDSTNRAINQLGRSEQLVAAPGDVSHVQGCESLVKAAIADLGGLDILVNSAGVAFEANIKETDEKIWDQTLNINLKGTFFCSRAAQDALLAGKGNIVNIASDAGLIGDPSLIAYCASKGGVVNMTRAMSLDLAPDVRVNCVCPGYVDTDMVRKDFIENTPDPVAAEQALVNYAPLKRLATPEEIATAIAYLASGDARFITGTALTIDGGGVAA